MSIFDTVSGSNDGNLLETIIWYIHTCVRIRKGNFCQQLQANWTVLVQVVDLLGLAGNSCNHTYIILQLHMYN